MTPSQIAIMRKEAQAHLGKYRSAEMLIDCLDEIVRLKRQVTHLSLRCKPAKKKKLGIGSTYGVGS